MISLKLFSIAYLCYASGIFISMLYYRLRRWNSMEFLDSMHPARAAVCMLIGSLGVSIFTPDDKPADLINPYYLEEMERENAARIN